ncbi:hypothetical protein [Limnohabitans sp. Hippo3]|uniref:hypothetical protein n=1 Tax=Limnohabitans sp. Hippo3 TaxID=1597956 RepID=UPI000D3D0822|nr:hypothetical protein [Limnohabitans sp. Hippo3]PUE43306.1 hypothetical protein B9Z34_00165 [Limnohabitans sp. Hippo3]
MLKNIALGIAIGLLVMGGIWGLVHLMGDTVAPPALTSESMPGGNKGVMDLICELELDLDGQLALGIKENEPSRITMAQVDFEKNSGWYQGKIAISESRAGTLSLMGTRLKIYRPAMFQRFGVMITGEEFVIDRKTGSFAQSLSLQDGRTVKLIKGTCAKVIKPPF